jgi:hypothetical protein
MKQDAVVRQRQGVEDRSDWGWCVDLAGAVTSLACLVHCLAWPILFGMLTPVMASVTEHGASTQIQLNLHLLLTAAAVALAAWAFIPGYRSHGRLSVPILATCGLVLILGTAWISGVCCSPDFSAGGNWESAIRIARDGTGPVGGVLLVVAHSLNGTGRRQQKADCC